MYIDKINYDYLGVFITNNLFVHYACITKAKDILS